ncbi:MAG: hypothetical protein M1147_10330 [Nitrospirae bacterium]|nr:hypothetical protein [Nitrospirota bacterium]MCL5978488.1 hypothetical protein [Nitrospirota bacterium]
MEILKTFEEKITYAVEKVKALKEEKYNLEKRIEDLEDAVRSKDMEIEQLVMEKASVKEQIAELLNELESLE